jgi:hypothetical protein
MAAAAGVKKFPSIQIIIACRMSRERETPYQFGQFLFTIIIA